MSLPPVPVSVALSFPASVPPGFFSKTRPALVKQMQIRRADAQAPSRSCMAANERR